MADETAPEPLGLTPNEINLTGLPLVHDEGHGEEPMVPVNAGGVVPEPKDGALTTTEGVAEEDEDRKAYDEWVAAGKPKASPLDANEPKEESGAQPYLPTGVPVTGGSNAPS